mmetsp:Transcript_5907/g.18088  ORF Transcript_5907/g.18088 Transcript_5907/m.18088 type:complete len:757 (+) Transcript_5907:224-2494(+)|eukprot:CAMPEP_0177669800 /NCGR_PEP_ID=MMETSP0447-20121125/23680_1 /TAXON_ID=0 /ORGANISM="Stygamoeba regulata, Strain BSH-02190019" /LENGTH=756 /DNA_ID=CAMNT_0019176783 /DNA_START=200 /DNA_END=2470 /DNA_ORIENTATION=-
MALETKHHFSESEKAGYVSFVNDVLAEDADLSSVLPIDPSSADLFEVVKDGVLLCKMIINCKEDAIDPGSVVAKPKNPFEQTQNHNMAIQAAQTIDGIRIVNIGPQDLITGTPHLVMGILWQIIKKTLLQQVAMNMDLDRLFQGEDGAAVRNAPPEQILLRWFNYHMREAGHHRTVTNFTEDIKDAECYAVLLRQICPEKITDADLEDCFREKDFLKRAEKVLELAERLGCRKFVTAKDIVEANPRLNLAFTAILFNTYPNLGPTAEEKARAEAQSLKDRLDAEREEALRLKGDLDTTRVELVDLSGKVKDLSLELADSLKEKNDILNAKLDLASQLADVQQDSMNLKLELDDSKKKNEDLFAQLEAELDLKLGFETQLKDTQAELENTRNAAAAEKEELEGKLADEIKAKNKYHDDLEKALADIDSINLDFENTKNDLNSQLENEVNAKNELDNLLNSTREELQQTKEAAAAKEEDLFSQLQATIGDLEATKKASAETKADLESQLATERATNEDLTKKLADKEAELQKVINDTDDEKLALLRRISQLEEELKLLKKKMRKELEAAEHEKEAMLSDAEKEKLRLLAEAEASKDQALDKVRMLLAGTQKSGWLFLQEKALLGGMKWKKRFFVLRDNYLCVYKSEDASDTKRPLGIVDCQAVRLYELEEKEIGRQFVFQVDNKKVQWNIATSKTEEMRSWMNEIRVAKKKKLGVKVVSEETAEQRRAREARESTTQASPRTPREGGAKPTAAAAASK